MRTVYLAKRWIEERVLNLIAPLILGLAPEVVFAAPKTYGDLAKLLITVLNAASGVAVALAIVVYLWGIASGMYKTGEADLKKRREFMIWGMIGLFVLVSVWGILGILINSIFGDNVNTAPYSATGASPP